MNRIFFIAILSAQASIVSAVDFKSQVAPVLKQYCYKCHSEAEKKEKGKLTLDNLTKFATKVGAGKMIIPGDAAGSSFMKSLELPKDDDDHMPPAKETQMTDAHIAIIKAWITEGASFEAGKAGPAPAPAAAPAMADDAAMGGGTAGGAPSVQTWTNTAGQSIQATFIRMEGESVVIQRADGQAFILPLEKLSPESQALAKKGGK